MLAFPNVTSALPLSRVPGPHVVLHVALLVVAVSKDNGIDSERGKCNGISKGLLRKRLLVCQETVIPGHVMVHSVAM